MNKSVTFVTILIVIFIGGAFSVWRYMQDKLPGPLQAKNTEEVKLSSIKIGDTSIPVEIALDSKSREKGLSGRASLPDNHGMLFVFARPFIYEFWMPDMRFPIDIIWILDDKVIGVTENIPPEQNLQDPTYYNPPGYINYALEVNTGFAKQRNIKVGDPVTLY